MKRLQIWEIEGRIREGDMGLMVVDCGYGDDEEAQNRADRIFALKVGKNNLYWGPSTYCPRIHILIPPKKIVAVTAALPISKEKTWYGASHSFLEG